jgi:hypothetical protein
LNRPVVVEIEERSPNKRKLWDPRLIEQATTRDELLALKDEVDTAALECRDQLKQAHNRRAETGDYADRDWYRRCENAVKLLGQQSQRIQTAMGKLRRQEAERRQARFEEAFITAAREILDHKTLSLIIGRAREIAK